MESSYSKGFDSGFERRRLSFDRLKDIYRRGSEASRGSESSPEMEAHWLPGMGVSPEVIDGIREYPAYEGASKEYLIYMLLLGKLVEEGAEWDPLTKTKVRNLVGVLRLVGFPNMTDREQSGLLEVSQAVGMENIQYEINNDVVSDVKWIWKAFGLRTPKVGGAEKIFGPKTQSERQPRSQRSIERQ